MLSQINVWFNTLLKASRDIKKADLEAARTARQGVIWQAGLGKTKKRSLIEALREGGKSEFNQQKIFFCVVPGSII